MGTQLPPRKGAQQLPTFRPMSIVAKQLRSSQKLLSSCLIGELPRNASFNLSEENKSQYGLETCPLKKSDVMSLDFVIDCLFVKLFKTKERTLRKLSDKCEQFVNSELPSITGLLHFGLYFTQTVIICTNYVWYCWSPTGIY